MKVIFLDFDGVLNSREYLSTLSRRGVTLDAFADIDPERVELLNQLIERTGAVVVLSTSWRDMFKGIIPFRERLGQRGFVGKIVGKTGNSHDGRGAEILGWLIQPYGYPIESWVALDDDATDMERLGDRFVQTSMETGLTQEHVDRACMLLGENLAATPKATDSARHSVPMTEKDNDA